MIKRILFLVFVLLLSKQEYAQNRAFEQQITGAAEILQLPGFSLAVVKDGKVVERYMSGYANLQNRTPVRQDDLFMIASVTKTMTANLVMQYEEEKKINIDDPVLNYRYIDIGFGWPYNIDPNTRIRHFLSQTSEDGPGASFVYNGSRFNYLYGIFEKASGLPPSVDAYQQELQKKVLTPLNMNHTIFGFPKNREDTLFQHIATPYLYDTTLKQFYEDSASYAQ